jgi:hypothetical protein
MSHPVRALLLTLSLLALGAVPPAVAHAGATGTVSKPKLSSAPVVGVPFTVSGTVRPGATAESRTVVRVKLYRFVAGDWRVTETCRAKLGAGASGTTYSRRLAVPARGTYAVRAFHYRAGKLVKRSERATFDVARRITIDSMVNGWLAPSLATTVASADTPLDIVFTTPSDWASEDQAKHYGAAYFIWGDFEKVSADGLIWHTEGLRPGRYDWMRDAMPKWGTGSLVVAQPIDIDKTSHVDTHALPYLPADISFGDVSSVGMGCDRSIAFVTRVFTQTSPDPLLWHTDGLVPGRYDWKCWMDECHYGTLVADGPAQSVTIAADPDETATAVPADTSLDIIFTGDASSMLCWRTIHFTTAGDFTKTSGYPDPVRWRTGGLAPGSYEWECWMGPLCHHGTVVVH